MSTQPEAAGPLPRPADYHLHTKWCGHAAGEMADYVEAGIAARLSEVGFAVHMPVTIPIDEKINLDRDQFRLYLDEAQRLRDAYAGRIGVLIGGEADFIPDRMDEIERLTDAFDYDFLLGAVHFVDGWNIDNPAYRDRWEAADVTAVYRRYYELLAEMARSGRFDIVSHFDLVKKFGYRPADDVTDAVAAAADAAAEAGMTVEINTAGWHKPVGEQYPSQPILRLLHQRAVPICLGSDAHAPEHVGRDFDRAVALARRVGWTEAVRYAARQASPVPLPPAA
ncbi:MAG: histidinol-phosphatase HisJ family protein [Planctomycetota bacterium]